MNIKQVTIIVNLPSCYLSLNYYRTIYFFIAVPKGQQKIEDLQVLVDQLDLR